LPVPVDTKSLRFLRMPSVLGGAFCTVYGQELMIAVLLSLPSLLFDEVLSSDSFDFELELL